MHLDIKIQIIMAYNFLFSFVLKHCETKLLVENFVTKKINVFDDSNVF